MLLPVNTPAPEKEGLARFVAEKRGITLSTFDGLAGLTKAVGNDGETQTYFVFNYFLNGVCVNHKYRKSITPGARKNAGFMQDKGEDGAISTLFNIDDASKYDEIIIVEGEFDALALKSAGRHNVVSVPNGAPSKVAELTDGPDNQFSYLETCKELLAGKRYVLAVDNDGPGHYLRESLALRLGRGNCSVVTWPKGIKDANEYLIQLGPKKLYDYVEVAKQPYPIKGLASWDEILPKEEPDYDPCPVQGLEFFNIGKRNLYVITGIPGHGKSTLARAIAVGMADAYGWHVTLASFEDDVHLDLKAELRTMWAGRYGNRRPDEDAIEDLLARHFSFIFDEGEIEEPMTVEWIIGMMYDAKRRFNTDMVVIDPWNQMDHDMSVKVPETRYISNSLRKIKKAAMDLGVVCVIVAHPRKMFENEVPTLYAISGSAAWNDKVDGGIIVHQNNYYEPDNTEVMVRVDKIKRRKLGKRGEACLRFDVINYQYVLPQG